VRDLYPLTKFPINGERVGITIEYVPIPQVEDGVADIDIANN
jgi:hypothetical protein